MATALIADIGMGLVGIALLLWADRIVGAIFTSAGIVGFCIVSSAALIRPMSAEAQTAGANGQAQSRAS